MNAFANIERKKSKSFSGLDQDAVLQKIREVEAAAGWFGQPFQITALKLTWVNDGTQQAL
jgi:hypothetical protein